LEKQTGSQVPHVGGGHGQPPVDGHPTGAGGAEECPRRAIGAGFGAERLDKVEVLEATERSVDEGPRDRPYLPDVTVGCELLDDWPNRTLALRSQGEHSPLGALQVPGFGRWHQPRT
jgi:hypothetical protein